MATETKTYRVTHSDEEWRRILSPEQYAVMRGHGTERPGSCALLHEKRPGTFVCAGCGEALFEGDVKFESGTGWPSFNTPVEGAVETTTDRSLGNLEQDTGLAPDLPRLLDQLLHHSALGLDGNAVRDLDQQLDQAIDHLALARHAVEGQQRQADALGVSAQLPGALDRRTSTETLDLVRVQAAQQVRRQREATQHLKLADLGQQAFQPDPAGVGNEAGERRALAAVGEHRVDPPACAGVETR